MKASTSTTNTSVCCQRFGSMWKDDDRRYDGSAAVKGKEADLAAAAANADAEGDEGDSDSDASGLMELMERDS